MNASITWLQRRWALPEAAVPAVRGLLHAESQGSTAFPPAEAVDDWGAAAAPPDAGGDTPVVFVEHDGTTFIQSRALFSAERDIARCLTALAGREAAVPDGAEAMLNALFPGAAPGDRQVEAARVAATRHLAVITGGPGTGKTYTLARILALLAAAGVAPARMRLAAPTGKAAQRMRAAVEQSLLELPDSAQAHAAGLEAVARGGSTLHALLRYHPGIRRCLCERLPPGTVLIVDECSMVDVHMWRTLLAALPPDARLILLGDPNQLESVGQGNVFAGLAAAADAAPLRGVHVHLTEARRFRDRPDILTLAKALEASDASAVCDLLENRRGTEALGGVGWIDTPPGVIPCERFPDSVKAALARVGDAPGASEALAALERVCILTAQRDAFVGARKVGSDIERYLTRRGVLRNHPVIINRNDPETHLRNGTVGVIRIDDDSSRAAHFLSGDGTPLLPLPVMKLPDHSPAWAITIHRSQGSEYDEVLVILPRGESPLATRELLYTAITRARRTVYIAGDLAAVRKAAATAGGRRSLLAYQFSHAGG
ncbi:MAG: exodeoxyribonuclease V subunit alpha [Opitutales bacterium]|nr:exodeoxyribonuclease V subunit alpha [Opitutales bacterium]